VVGSGPNGLAAAIVLQRAGLSVLLMEAKDTIGGGMRTEELTLPGFMHDICSAVHPMAASSPFFSQLPLHDHGLDFIYPPTAAAHPFDDGDAAVLKQGIGETASSLGVDAVAYQKLMKGLIKDWPSIYKDILNASLVPAHPLPYARFGCKALLPATLLSRKYFKTQLGRGLFAGMAAHSMLPLSYLATSAIGLVLMVNAHLYGWPIPRGGARSIAKALGAYFISLGGKIELNTRIRSLAQVPGCRALLLDIGPRQLLEIAGQRLSAFYQWQLKRYRYGMGVFKIDWALDGTVPFTSPACGQAGTIHLGNSFGEIAGSESDAHKGVLSERPFVLMAQPSLFDPGRAPAGKHTVWAYCHTPPGSVTDRTEAIERQVERFAPGFRERIIARHTMNCAEMEAYNPNYAGGDINGGAQDLGQIFTRPALRFSPYRTSAKGIYLCSASTPPGGGVHGMCGYHAAWRALKDIFFRQDKKIYLVNPQPVPEKK
jgi:phytoene dehydrogenase-like protein